MKFKLFIKEKLKFLKKHFKKISLSVISVVSALVIFSVPVSALNSSVNINAALGLYATNSSIREGNFDGVQWGMDFQTIPFSRSWWIGVGARKPYYEVVYDKIENSYELQNKYLVTTFQILNNDFTLEHNKAYKVTFTLFFKMATTKTIVTDHLKFAFWDINDNSSNPYLNFFSDEEIQWKSNYDTILDGYVSRFTFYLKNDYGRDISPTHIRFAIRFKSTLKLWEGNSWGFYDSIKIEDSNFTWIDGNLNIYSGLAGVSSMLSYLVKNVPMLDDMVKFSINLGIAALIVGFTPSIISSFTHSHKSSNKQKTHKGG